MNFHKSKLGGSGQSIRIFMYINIYSSVQKVQSIICSNMPGNLSLSLLLCGCTF